MSSGNVPHFPKPTDTPPIANLRIIIIIIVILGNTALGDILTTQLSTTSNTKCKDVLKYFNFHSVPCYLMLLGWCSCDCLYCSNSCFSCWYSSWQDLCSSLFLMLRQSVMFRISVGKEIMRTLNFMSCTAVLTNACQNKRTTKTTVTEVSEHSSKKNTCTVIRKILKNCHPCPCHGGVW